MTRSAHSTEQTEASVEQQRELAEEVRSLGDLVDLNLKLDEVDPSLRATEGFVSLARFLDEALGERLPADAEELHPPSHDPADAKAGEGLPYRLDEHAADLELRAATMRTTAVMIRVRERLRALGVEDGEGS
jgi:hypothetical protein